MKFYETTYISFCDRAATKFVLHVHKQMDKHNFKKSHRVKDIPKSVNVSTFFPFPILFFMSIEKKIKIIFSLFFTLQNVLKNDASKGLRRKYYNYNVVTISYSLFNFSIFNVNDRLKFHNINIIKITVIFKKCIF